MLQSNHTAEINIISAQIAQELEVLLPVWYGNGAHLMQVEPTVRANRNSLLLLYPFQDRQQNQRRVYVKLARRQRMKTLADAITNTTMRERAQIEYHLLMNIDDATKRYAPKDMCAVRPLGYLPQWNAVVTEELQSRSLKSMMYSPSSLFHVQGPQQNFERAFSLAGSWLRLFHTQVGNCQLEIFDHTNMLRELDRLFDGLAQHTTYDLRKVREVFQKRVHAQNGRAIPVALIHGDYGAFNVFMTADGRVGALDVGETHRNMIYFDIGWFLADLRISRLQTLSWGHILKKETVRAYERAFLGGYFQNEPVDQELLTLMSLYYVLLKWFIHEENFRQHIKTSHRFVRPWIQRYLYRVTLTLVSHLETL